jgi:hypothetical protein
MRCAGIPQTGAIGTPTRPLLATAESMAERASEAEDATRVGCAAACDRGF